jgi:hypothetical protein
LGRIHRDFRPPGAYGDSFRASRHRLYRYGRVFALATAFSTLLSMQRNVTLTILDPVYKGRVLATRTELSASDARTLAAIYRALGYPPASIVSAVTKVTEFATAV